MRALELSQLKSPDGKVELFGDVDPRDSRQGDSEQIGADWSRSQAPKGDGFSAMVLGDCDGLSHCF